MNALKEMGLLAGMKLNRVHYDGHIRIPTVHNDYHMRETNGGYSRNSFGGYFPKWLNNFKKYISDILAELNRFFIEGLRRETKRSICREIFFQHSFLDFFHVLLEEG